MIISTIKPQNLPETLIWYYIISTYLIYYLGAQYLLAQVLGFFLVFYLIRQWWNQTEETPAEAKITISFSAWVWVIAVLAILTATIVNHYTLDLELKRFIESFAAWSRTWALFGVFPLAGHLKIRPELVYRAISILCIQSLIIIIVGTLAGLVHIPHITYVSPLKSLPLNGGTPQYEVDVFHTLINSRMRLFTPWAPALGLTSNIYFFMILQEQNKRLRWIGIVSTIASIIGSVSRAGMVCLPVVLLSTWVLKNFLRPWVQFIAGGISFVGSIYLQSLIEFLQVLKEDLKNARAGSSEARDGLERIALYRWQTEAPIWGHGVSEPGPLTVGRKPIGTHHTWFGLLFTHGLVGCVALAVAMLWTFIDLLIKSQRYKTALVGLQIIMVLGIYSFSEHFDGSIFVFWPGLLMLGVAFREGQSLYSFSKPQSKIQLEHH